MKKLSFLHHTLFSLALIPMAPGLLASLQAQPAAFYTDLESGPNSGGENSAGAYVTIYGKSFGATRGSSQITVGGGLVAAYPVWSDSKVSFQLGSAAVTGNIVVATAAGTSNPLPFTVRAGNVYFVSTQGNDTSAGSFTAPWKTLPFAVRAIKNGDIIYSMNGVSQPTDDGEGWNSAMTLRNEWCSGSGYPRALVASPGAKVTIGATTATMSTIRSTDGSAGGGACVGNWIFAGLTLLSSSEGTTLAGGNNWRMVGNEMTCPNGDGAGACFESSQASNIKFYGNNIHDTGKSGASALYQGVYFSTDSNHLDIGWNTIANVRGCRGLQIHSSPLGNGGAGDPTGFNQFDISIHDNVIHDTQCDGIVISTVDPSVGQVSVFRNIIYNAGKGPNTPEMSGSWTCLTVQGHTNNGPAGGGVVEVYSNSMYDCGSFTTPPYGGANGSLMNGGENTKLSLRIRNNIFSQLNSAAPYLIMYDPITGSVCADSDNCKGIFGTNNLFAGIGPSPVNSNITASVGQNPLFVNAAGRDFHLATGSPAANSGTAVPQTTDFDGLAIPRGSGYPIGAYDLGAAVPVGVRVSVGPSGVTLFGGQTQSFTATVSGTANTSVTWSVSPGVGTVTSAGVYTAPAIVLTTQSVVVSATSVADGSRSASVTINLTPISVSGLAAASLTAGQTQQFAAIVSGTTNTAVNWNLSAAIGTLTASGLYTAPGTIASQQTIAVTATSVLDGTKFATAIITLIPTISVAVNPATVTLGAGGTQQFSAAVTGSGTVIWSRTPTVGTVSTSGLYTAPLTVALQQTITVKATSTADNTKFATSIVTLTPIVGVSITMKPSTVTLTASGTQQFSATVTGTNNTQVTWTQSAAIGTLSASGLYTAPTSVTVQRTIQITATSAADSTKFATVIVTLTPTVSVAMTPGSVTLGGSATQQFSAAVTGNANTAVTWSLSPAVGLVSPSGLYTAPALNPANQAITIKATSTADSSKFATAIIGLLVSPAPTSSGGATEVSALTVSYALLTNTTAQVSWTAPLSRPVNDWISLTSSGAQGWWYITSWPTNGATKGTFTVTVPKTPGQYEFRYYDSGTFNVLAHSASLAVGTGFSVNPTSTVAVAGSTLTVPWTAGLGRLTGDCVCLLAAGTDNGQTLGCSHTQGKASGKATFDVPATPGVYEVRYITRGYVNVVTSAPITVK